MSQAENIAQKMTAALETGDLQICNYGSRVIVKRGCTVKADGNGIRLNGKGAFFPVGSFKVYSYK